MGVKLKVDSRDNPSRDRDQRQIAIVCYELHGRWVFVGIAIAFHRQVAAVADDMRVCKNAIATYDEAGPNTALDPSRIPGRFVIRLHGGCGDADQTFLNRPVWLWRCNRNRNSNYRLRNWASFRWTCR